MLAPPIRYQISPEVRIGQPVDNAHSRVRITTVFPNMKKTEGCWSLTVCQTAVFFYHICYYYRQYI